MILRGWQTLISPLKETGDSTKLSPTPGSAQCCPCSTVVIAVVTVTFLGIIVCMSMSWCLPERWPVACPSYCPLSMGTVTIAALLRQALGSQKQKFQGQFRLSEPGWRRLQGKLFIHKAGLKDAWTPAKATSCMHDFIPLSSFSLRAQRAICTQRLETREYKSRQWERPEL